MSGMSAVSQPSVYMPLQIYLLFLYSLLDRLIMLILYMIIFYFFHYDIIFHNLVDQLVYVSFISCRSFALSVNCPVSPLGTGKFSISHSYYVLLDEPACRSIRLIAWVAISRLDDAFLLNSISRAQYRLRTSIYSTYSYSSELRLYMSALLLNFVIKTNYEEIINNFKITNAVFIT